MNDGYKEALKEINMLTITVCWLLNLFLMFVYSKLAIFIANILALLIVNTVTFIVWKVM